NPVSQVEDEARPSSVLAEDRLAARHDLLTGSQKDRGIEISLNRMLISENRSGLRQGHAIVEPEHVGMNRAQRLEMSDRGREREVDGWCPPGKPLDHRLRRGGR